MLFYNTRYDVWSNIIIQHTRNKSFDTDNLKLSEKWNVQKTKTPTLKWCVFLSLKMYSYQAAYSLFRNRKSQDVKETTNLSRSRCRLGVGIFTGHRIIGHHTRRISLILDDTCRQCQLDKMMEKFSDVPVRP